MFKKGQQVVKILRCAGIETATIRTVQKVSAKGLQLDGDSAPWYDKQGRELEPGLISGVSTRLVMIEGDDE